MAGGLGDMSSLLKQAQEMQRRMQETRRDLEQRIVEGSAGGGVVKVRVNGNQELQSVKIDKAVVDPADVDGLEDLVTVAARQAFQAAKELQEQEMGKITGGMSLPGMGF